MARPAYGGRPTCESHASIDARRWYREGRLRPDQYFLCSWKCRGEPSGEMIVMTGRDDVILIYKSFSWGRLRRSLSFSKWPSLGQASISVVGGPGSSATAGDVSRCFMSSVNGLAADAATASCTQANRNRPAIETSVQRKRSERDLAAA
jgi:hypothetical protein